MQYVRCMMIIELLIDGGKTRYAENSGKTWDGSCSVCLRVNAKRFTDIHSVHCWLYRYGFMVRDGAACKFVSCLAPAPFVSYKVVTLSPTGEPVLFPDLKK